MTYVEKIDVAIDMYLNKEKQTRTKLAEELSMTPESLSNKRSGETDWTFSEVLKLSQITGLSVSFLAK